MDQLGIILVIIFSIIGIICFSIFFSFTKGYKHFDEIKDRLLKQFPIYTEETLLSIILNTRKNSIIALLISLLFVVCGILFIVL